MYKPFRHIIKMFAAELSNANIHVGSSLSRALLILPQVQLNEVIGVLRPCLQQSIPQHLYFYGTKDFWNLIPYL